MKLRTFWATGGNRKINSYFAKKVANLKNLAWRTLLSTLPHLGNRRNPTENPDLIVTKELQGLHFKLQRTSTRRHIWAQNLLKCRQ